MSQITKRIKDSRTERGGDNEMKLESITEKTSRAGDAKPQPIPAPLKKFTAFENQ